MGAQGTPILKNDEKVTSITLRLGPHFGIVFVIFGDFVLFGGSLLRVFVFESFRDSILAVLGIIFECFADAFLCFFY